MTRNHPHPGIIFLPAVFLALNFSGCAYWKSLTQKKAPPPAPSKKIHSRKAPPQTNPSHEKPVDTEAQERYYNQGLKYYADENYVEAKKSWQQVLQLGSKSALAIKAKEYLKKTDQVLKTLKEMEKQ